jgi:deoxyribodipyrimidine photo-lyase
VVPGSPPWSCSTAGGVKPGAVLRPTIVWLRLDLRLEDNPALGAALDRGGPVVPAFAWAPHEELPWEPGAASKWWLHHSLRELARSLDRLGSRLILRRGDTLDTLRELVRETGAGAVYWCRRYEPRVLERDAAVQQALRREGIEAESFNAGLLFEPWRVSTAEGRPYRVFTPFYRACLRGPEVPAPRPAPRELRPPVRWPASLPLDALGLEPRHDWAEGLRARFTPGERGAQERLSRFLDQAVEAYPDDRDRPDLGGTSCLSPYLHFGEIGPRAVWHAVRERTAAVPRPEAVRGAEAYLRQLVWREFAHHLLFHFPHTTDRPLREEFSGFPWREDPAALRAWRKGGTGYPFVDAGMRELWKTGFMHNRVRMAVASFLVKDLLLPWQEGARWFWDTLVDADLADNTLGWQWTAGCGPDAAPFFRIFSPTIQGRRHDPRGAYVRRYVPELAALPDRHLLEPWRAPQRMLRDAGIVLGRDYPLPIVDHREARGVALAAYGRLGSKR